MGLNFIQKWKYNSELEAAMLRNSALQRNHVDVGIFTDKFDDNQIEELLQHIKHSTKNVSVRVLQYKEITSKEPKASTYFKNNVQWSGVPKAAAIDEFLSNHYSICFIFIHRINAHKMFILDQLNADFVKGSYVKGLEKYAKFMLDSDHTILKDTYTAIMKTLEELS